MEQYAHSFSVKKMSSVWDHVHYMAKSMWLSNITFQIHECKYGFSTPVAAITASTFLGRLSIRCWNIAAETCFHSATRALARVGTDIGELGLAHNRLSNSSQKCSMGLRSGLCVGQSSFSTCKKPNFCMDLALSTGALSC